jgi:hypothetical protein
MQDIITSNIVIAYTGSIPILQKGGEKQILFAIIPRE